MPSLGELLDVDLEHPPGAMTGAELQGRLAAVCPAGLEILSAEPVVTGAPGLGKLIVGTDLVIAPAADGIAHDAARLARIAAAFEARDAVVVTRGERAIDVRALVAELEVVAGDDAVRLCAALDWPEAPALVRVRVRTSPAGSAKPIEVARALGIAGDDDPRAPHARIARLGLVEAPPPPPVAKGEAAAAAARA